MRGLTPLDGALLLVPGYLVGGVVAPFVGRLADRLGPVLPATAGLFVQVVAMLLYARLGVATPLWVVSAVSVVNGMGSGGFFPANNAAVMKAAPRPVFGLASGLLRTFANVGMIFSFSLALVVAAHAISRRLAFLVFVGTAVLSGSRGAAFLSGIHAAMWASVAGFVVAGLLSAARGIRAPGLFTGVLSEQDK